ncbi:hypothetical protein CHU98_g2542 [Xylaria longipes]|nr:hypothetical protein CHU98_g2542 [Xylaria longipes]
MAQRVFVVRQVSIDVMRKRERRLLPRNPSAAAGHDDDDDDHGSSSKVPSDAPKISDKASNHQPSAIAHPATA